MNEIDLRRIDLNLLVAFQALLAERHVGRAATRLALTQSAASHALGRLRKSLGDPLFVRHPKGIEPTTRALALAPTIAEILERARSVFSSAGEFDASVPRSFTIGMVDYNLSTIVVPLIERLRLVAPAIDVRVLPLSRGQVVVAFDRQEIDIALLIFPRPPARIARQPVLADRYIGVARRGHPGLRKLPLTRKAFADLSHVLVSTRGVPAGLLDQPFPKLDRLRRRVAVTVPNVSAALQIVAATDLVALTFERIARRFQDALDLVLFEPPIAIPGFTTDILTSADRADDPALRWLRDQIVQVCSDGA